MLTLENVKKENNIISAEYCFSGYKERGFFSYDINQGKFNVLRFGDVEKPEEVYGFSKVKYLLKQMISYNNYPQTVSCRWY